MGLNEDLTSAVGGIFRAGWATSDGVKVPDDERISLFGNQAVKLNGAVLYADLADSTSLVNNSDPTFAAEVFKTYLYCAARVVNSEGGSITAYDGDRIMAVYVGDRKCTRAARTALMINYCVLDIINPALVRKYPGTTYRVRQCVGIDVSALFVARTGARGANDLVWVGRAANYAAKLAAIRGAHSTHITAEAYAMLADDGKFSDTHVPMWKQLKWNTFDNSTIRGSTWRWRIS
jgi:class 3 adenylate cyclase